MFYEKNNYFYNNSNVFNTYRNDILHNNYPRHKDN